MMLALACCLAIFPGFAKPATIDEIAKHAQVLTPGRYVGAEDIEEDAEPFAEKYPRLVAEVGESFLRGRELEDVVLAKLRGLSHG